MSATAHLLLHLRRLIPNQGVVSHRERLRASVGAMVGLLITGLVSRVALGATGELPLLIAPMGASAVLLFAVPSSPLAQPWSILGGNTVAALIGITCGRYLADPVVAAALACAGAIGAMLILRCLHPPSGAVALTAVLGGPAIHAAGYGFAVWPVGLNGVLLLGAAVLFNNATGRRYPHRVPTPAVADAMSSTPAAVTRRDVGAVLRRHDEIVDVDRDDLLELVREAEHVARSRLSPLATAADLMTPVGTTLTPGTAIEAAIATLRTTTRATTFVTSAEGHLVGAVDLAAVLRHLRPTEAGRKVAHMFQRSIRFDLEPRSVGDIMRTAVQTVRPDATADRIAALMIDSDLSSLPVVDEAGVLIGTVDVIAVMALFSRSEKQTQPRSVIQRL